MSGSVETLVVLSAQSSLSGSVEDVGVMHPRLVSLHGVEHQINLKWSLSEFEIVGIRNCRNCLCMKRISCLHL